MHQRCPLSSQHAHVAVDVSAETRASNPADTLNHRCGVREPFDDTVSLPVLWRRRFRRWCRKHASSSNRHRYLQQAQDHSSLIGGLNEGFHVQQRITDMIRGPGAPTVGGVVKVGKTVFGAASHVGIVAVLSVYFLADMPRIRATVYRFVPNSRSRAGPGRRRNHELITGEEMSYHAVAECGKRYTCSPPGLSGRYPDTPSRSRPADDAIDSHAPAQVIDGGLKLRTATPSGFSLLMTCLIVGVLARRVDCLKNNQQSPVSLGEKAVLQPDQCILGLGRAAEAAWCWTHSGGLPETTANAMKRPFRRPSR